MARLRITIPGGSGLIGRILTRHFQAAGDDVTIIARNLNQSPGLLSRTITWDGRTLGPWIEAVDGADVVINLAGRSVNCRYNTTNRRLIKRVANRNNTPRWPSNRCGKPSTFALDKCQFPMWPEASADLVHRWRAALLA